jgi:hypothetical protein
MIVCAVHACEKPWSVKPPQRSTTGSPSTKAQIDAPMLSPLTKLILKASRTGSKPGRTKPATGEALAIDCSTLWSMAAICRFEASGGREVTVNMVELLWS